jgi:hypothetical protein
MRWGGSPTSGYLAPWLSIGGLALGSAVVTLAVEVSAFVAWGSGTQLGFDSNSCVVLLNPSRGKRGDVGPDFRLGGGWME